ncbi:hypothetical protein D5F01_LYC18232 [Larimichthys crocea]|uniref:Uncharacterized protein n=1 Tax=Larimichthys crocea TaxID=215358 RepID=A0A6G0HUZ7_LARCR|nr:hypothetical protein D5F01_LYC18232 [Larimichthys crocea]
MLFDVAFHTRPRCDREEYLSDTEGSRLELIRLGSDALASPGCHGDCLGPALPSQPCPASAATTEPGFDERREHRHEPAARLVAPPVDYNFHGKNASQTDYNVAAALSQTRTNRQNLHDRKDYMKSSVDEETSTFRVENQGSYQSNSNSGSDDSVRLDVPTEGGTLRTQDISKDNSLPKDYNADSSSRQDYSSFVDFSKDAIQDSTERLLQVSTTETLNAVSPAAILRGQRDQNQLFPRTSSECAYNDDGKQVDTGGWKRSC